MFRKYLFLFTLCLFFSGSAQSAPFYRRASLAGFTTSIVTQDLQLTSVWAVTQFEFYNEGFFSPLPREKGRGLLRPLWMGIGFPEKPSRRFKTKLELIHEFPNGERKYALTFPSVSQYYIAWGIESLNFNYTVYFYGRKDKEDKEVSGGLYLMNSPEGGEDFITITQGTSDEKQALRTAFGEKLKHSRLSVEWDDLNGPLREQIKVETGLTCAESFYDQF